MQFPFDDYLKKLLREPLATIGTVTTEEAVAVDAQRIDIRFHPRRPPGPASRELGLLGRVGRSACILEPFHALPSFDEIRGSIRKLLAWHHLQTLRAHRRARARAAAGGPPARSDTPAPTTPPDTPITRAIPVLWIITAGRPRRAVEGFAFHPLHGWPTGVHAMPPTAIPVRLVVVSELPTTRDTLLFRLMGRGPVLRDAMTELAALPPDSWERSKLTPFLIELLTRISKAETTRPLTPEEKELVVTGQDMILAIEQLGEKRGEKRGRKEGLKEGREAGREEGRKEASSAIVTRIFSRRLDRPLTEREHATLLRRLEKLGVDRLTDVALTLDAKALASWLTSRVR